MDPLSPLPAVDEEDKLQCNSSECSVNHLDVHKKAHSMTLSIDSLSSAEGKTPLFIADETPTPTRFIRNCEEVGLFQDLQHVNPFDEQFRRAAEIVSQASPSLSLTSERAGDDVLHTPHVFPPAVEIEPVLPPPKSASVKRHFLIPTLSTSECLHLPSPLPTPTPGVIVSSIAPQPLVERLEREPSPNPPPKKRGRKPNTKNSNPLKVPTGGAVCIKPRPSELPANSCSQTDTLQLLVRLPDGRLVQIPAMPVATESSTAATAAVSTVSSAVTQEPRNVIVAASASETIPVTGTSMISEAKIKLKEVLSKAASNRNFLNSPPSAASNCGSVSSDNGTDNDLSAISPADTHDANSVANNEDDEKQQRHSTSDNETEAEKRRKYLERNRAAAFRSRQKRKSWINSLESRTNDLSKANKSLQNEVLSLRSEVAKLKAMLLAHKDCPVTLEMKKNSQDLENNQSVVVTDMMPTTNQIASIYSPSSIEGNTNNNLPARQIILVSAAAPLLALPLVNKALNS